MSLADVKLRTLTISGKHFDGAGLYLEVTPSGGRYWRLKYRHGGKEKRLSFGVYPEVGLKDAREQATKARRVLAAGTDPSELRKAAKSDASQVTENTLQAVATAWLKHQAPRWEDHTATRIRASLDLHVFPELGPLPVATIAPPQIQAVIKRIEARGTGDMASRVLQRLKALWRWAVVNGRTTTNPVADLKPSEVLAPRRKTHRAALAERDLPLYLSALAAYEGDPHTTHAMRLLILTATRPGELRGARWAEINLEAAEWVIPAARMKMRAEHRVPLSRQALQLLTAMQAFSGHRELVFPSPFYPSKPLSDNTFNSALARMGFKNIATAHGFRALFSTIANESGQWSADAIERQLAHKEQNQTRAAYHRASYWPERQRLMQWWADYLDTRAANNVVTLPQRAA